MCEAVIDGRYYWVPFERLRFVALEAPSESARCRVDAGAPHSRNGGETAALIPARYPGSEADGDGLIRLARKTSGTRSRRRHSTAVASGCSPLLVVNMLLSVRRIELGGSEREMVEVGARECAAAPYSTG